MIGRTRQAIWDRINRQIENGDTNEPMEFKSVTGERILVKIFKTKGGTKWLLTIVSTEG